MRRIEVGLVSVMFAFGCGETPPPAAPPPPPPPQPVGIETQEVSEPEHDVPECRSLEENCTVDGSARLVLNSSATVQPPAGWGFSSSEEHGIRVVPPQGGAVMAFVHLDSSKPDEIWARLYGLLSELGVKGVEPKAVDLEQPQTTWTADGLDIRAWQVEKSQLEAVSKQAEDPQMDGEPGALLVALSQLDNTSAVLAVAFLKRSAPPELVEPIRQTLQGLSRSVPAPASSPESATGGDSSVTP